MYGDEIRTFLQANPLLNYPYVTDHLFFPDRREENSSFQRILDRFRITLMRVELCDSDKEGLFVTFFQDPLYIVDKLEKYAFFPLDKRTSRRFFTVVSPTRRPMPRYDDSFTNKYWFLLSLFHMHMNSVTGWCVSDKLKRMQLNGRTRKRRRKRCFYFLFDGVLIHYDDLGRTLSLAM